MSKSMFSSYDVRFETDSDSFSNLSPPPLYYYIYYFN